MKIIFLLVISNILLFSSQACIKNFGKTICSDFKILNSVIIKTSLSKKELKKKINKHITQLAFLEDTNIFLIDSKNPLEYAKKLEKENFIIYAQPNISQTRNKNFKNSKEFLTNYNIKNKWKSTKGQGVNIAIIDDGFDLEHEDLKDVNLLFRYDADNKIIDSKPKTSKDTHGTQVAGVIFSSHNGIGADGIAPKANLIAIRQATNVTSDTILAFTVAQKAGANIVNCSWNSPILLEPIYDVIKYISKNTAIVFAAGNNGKKIEPLSIEASIPEVITVGATQKYSNYGKMVDFIIPSNIYTTKANNHYGSFGGTSATAPIISGLIALELSNYPDKSIEEIVQRVKKRLKIKLK